MQGEGTESGTMRQGIVILVMLIALVSGFGAASALVNAKCGGAPENTRAKECVLKVIGNMPLAVCGECAGPRALTEGPSNCLGAMPGGYCLHVGCVVVACTSSCGIGMVTVREGKRAGR